MRIHVEHGVVRQAMYQEKHIPVPQDVIDNGGAPTIGDTFDELEEYLEELPDEWLVAYDDEFGYPTYVYVDFDQTRKKFTYKNLHFVWSCCNSCTEH